VNPNAIAERVTSLVQRLRTGSLGVESAIDDARCAGNRNGRQVVALEKCRTLNASDRVGYHERRQVVAKRKRVRADCRDRIGDDDRRQARAILKPAQSYDRVGNND
jgi:hypothetical protein